MTPDRCGLAGCARPAAGYVDPGPDEAHLEVYVGPRRRAQQVPLCTAHIVELSRRPQLTRKELFGLQWPALR